MVAYHGTNFERGRKILMEMLIRRSERDFSTYTSTTDGFVFLADNFETALDYGIRSWGANRTSESKRGVFVFKVDVDSLMQYPDWDETEHLDWVMTAEQSREAVKSFSVSEDIDLEEHGIEFILIKLGNKTDPYYYFDSLKNEYDHEWKPFKKG